MVTILNVSAGNELTVGNVDIPYGGMAAIEINCNFDTLFKGFQLDIELEEGIELVSNEAGDPIGEIGFATDHIVSSNKISNNKYRFAVVSFTGQTLGQSGTVLRIFVTSNSNAAVGSSFSGKISAIEFTTADIHPYYFDDMSFNITIGEPEETMITLDENENIEPSPATGVNVRVKRTIKANTWSSLVLPFSMTSEQMKSAFGNDVECAEFVGWETTTYDADDNPTDISIRFSDVNSIEANIPYIIKTSSDIVEFDVDDVSIQPETDPCVTVGKINRGTFGSFTGSYVPITIDEECLFLYDNKFWYSSGLSKMKGYRAYFYFQAVLGSYYTHNTANVNMYILHDNEEVTCINNTNSVANFKTTTIPYAINGVKVGQHYKGIVIKDGKKYYNK